MMSNKNKTEFIRVVKDKNYTVINNEFIRRPDLSWKSKGILVYILSLPDDWNINLNEVMNHATEGESAFRSGWKELNSAGYVERKPVRDKKNKIITHWETIVYENADVARKKPHSENPQVDNQDVDNQDVDNRKLLSTEELSTEELSTESKVPYVEIITYLNDVAGKSYRTSTNKTKDLIKARWNENFRMEDFKKVIDIKNNEWKDNEDMQKFIRPETLFGPKFEGYLNQGSNGPKDDGYNYGF